MSTREDVKKAADVLIEDVLDTQKKIKSVTGGEVSFSTALETYKQAYLMCAQTDFHPEEVDIQEAAKEAMDKISESLKDLKSSETVKEVKNQLAGLAETFSKKLRGEKD
jgi:hypothetical protein